MLLLLIFIYSSLLPLCNRLGYERPTPHPFNRYQHPFRHTSGASELSSLTLYIDLWQEEKPAPGQNPPVISPPVVIFRRIGVRAEIRTQNPVLSNTRLAKMVPLSHIRQLSLNDVRSYFFYYNLFKFIVSDLERKV
jgi:hypothetical protein